MGPPSAGPLICCSHLCSGHLFQAAAAAAMTCYGRHVCPNANQHPPPPPLPQLQVKLCLACPRWVEPWLPE